MPAQLSPDYYYYRPMDIKRPCGTQCRWGAHDRNRYEGRLDARFDRPHEPHVRLLTKLIEVVRLMTKECMKRHRRAF